MDQRLEHYRAEMAYRREELLGRGRPRRMARIARLRAALLERGATRTIRDSLTRAA